MHFRNVYESSADHCPLLWFATWEVVGQKIVRRGNTLSTLLPFSVAMQKNGAAECDLFMFWRVLFAVWDQLPLTYQGTLKTLILCG